MNKLRAYFRSDSELERHFAQHFPSLPPGELCFWRYKVSGRWLEISGRRLEISGRRLD